MVDEKSLVLIFKNNNPKYIVVDFEEYEAVKEIKEAREKRIEKTADSLIEEK